MFSPQSVKITDSSFYCNLVLFFSPEVTLHDGEADPTKEKLKWMGLLSM